MQVTSTADTSDRSVVSVSERVFAAEMMAISAIDQNPYPLAIATAAADSSLHRETKSIPSRPVIRCHG